jgi:hypothetical protein
MYDVHTSNSVQATVYMHATRAGRFPSDLLTSLYYSADLESSLSPMEVNSSNAVTTYTVVTVNTIAYRQALLGN